jgi:hypothetical protein
MLKLLLLLLILAGPVAARVNIVNFGAVGDGVTDNTAALKRAILRAEATHQAVYLPAGVYAYRDVLELHGVQMVGDGRASVLRALNWRRSAIFLYGAGPGVQSLRLTGVRAPTRQANWESTRITVFGATDFLIAHVVIEGSSAAGIQMAQSPSGGRIIGNTISGTLSDAIHLTDGAAHILVENNRISDAGDDGIAVVSYRGQPMVWDITARGNVVKANRWGRLMSVVGGRDVLYERNILTGNLAHFACLYIAQEDSFNTYAAHDVTVQKNRFAGCGGTDTGHGAVMIWSEGTSGNTGIVLSLNDVRAGSATGVREVGVKNRGIVLDRNRIAGTGAQYDLEPQGVTVAPYVSGPVGPNAP